MPHIRRILTITLLYLMLIISASLCYGAPDPASKPPAVPAWQSSSPEPTPTIKKMADLYVRPMVESGRHIGIVVGIIQGDKRWVLSYGRKELGSDIPPNADTVYEIGSVTKTFTSAVLAIMAGKGEVSLTHPVSKYLPKSVLVPSYKGRKITLENLSTHTSGLPRMPDNFNYLYSASNPYAAYSPADSYKFLSHYCLECAPGKKCEYSNFGAGLLGLALSRARKASYGNMITALICKPLGLKDTAITLSKDQRARLAPGYTLKKKDDSFTIVPTANWTFQDSFAGAGALRSTANDMLTYLAANMGITITPLKVPLLSMQKSRFKEDDTTGIGLAWQILTMSKDDPPIIWHNGGTGGYCSFIGFCRERNAGVVILSNTSSLEDGEEDEDLAGFKLLMVLMYPKLLR